MCETDTAYRMSNAIEQNSTKKPELFLRIISLAHAPMNVTDVSISSIICDPNNADGGSSIIRVT
jgi:hypothetical protein